MKRRALPTPAMVDDVSKMLGKSGCELPGQSAREFDVTLPYVVLVEPDGSAFRVVVRDIGCPEMEQYTGAIVLSRAKHGDIPATGARTARWYRGTMNYNLRDETR